MKITSKTFSQDEKIPTKYTCDGQGINPPLTFIQVPEQAKSLVLIVDDPDAPGNVFNHWVVWNIDPQIKDIKEGSVPPQAVEGQNGGNETGYYPPCPPTGTHRYFFRLYALDTELDLPPGEQRAELEKEMSGHILEEASLMGTYSR